MIEVSRSKMWMKLALVSLLGVLVPDLALAQNDSDTHSEKSQPDQRMAQPSSKSGSLEERRTQSIIDEYSQQVGQPKSLTELLDFAAENAPDIQRARERIGLGDAAIEGAERISQFNPELEGQFGVGLDEVGLSNAEVVLKQRFEIAGERGLRIAAAEERKRALSAELAQASWDVHQKVHRLYRLGLVDQERIEVEREILEFTQQLFRIAQARYEAGEEPRTSVIVAKAEMATARQRVVQTWFDYVRTLRDLGATLGWSDDAPPQPLGDLDEARPVPTKAALLNRAYEKDPQLAVLKARRQQAHAELALEERKVWPNPMLGLGWEGENLGANDLENTLRLVIGIPLPLWDRNQGEIAASQTRSKIFLQAIANRKEVLKSLVFKQAEGARSAYTQAQIYEQEVLPALEEQLEMLQEGFRLGELSLLDVMNARDRLLAVQRQYLDALGEYFVAISQLEELLGASIWEPVED